MLVLTFIALEFLFLVFACGANATLIAPTFKPSFTYSYPGTVKFQWTPFDLPKSHEIIVTLNCVHEGRDPVCDTGDANMHRALFLIASNVSSSDGALDWDVGDRSRQETTWYQKSLESKGVQVTFAIIHKDAQGHHHALSRTYLPVLLLRKDSIIL